MPFIPHTMQDTEEMLGFLGLDNIDDLFDEIPENIRINGFKNLPQGINEMEVGRLMRERAKQDEAGLCFIGAGAYEHHIPAAVWEITGRGEFMTAYTPYQAEASQGTLQTIYEYQTMMSNLTGMDVSNACLYDGASAVAEAALMAVRANRKSKSKKILIPANLHPIYRKTAVTIAGPQQLEFVEIPYELQTGLVDFVALNRYSGKDVAAAVVPLPNFFGGIEDVDAITDWAHKNGALVIAVVNPIAISLLKDPGSWGEQGADIVVGDGQPLGIPLASGGPYFGFMCCKNEFLRTMPGRIIGKTTDKDGNIGYVLNLQAREQHIRRAKATSNICTNHGLMATAATIFTSLLGAEGLKRMALNSHHNANALYEKLIKLDGVEKVFTNNFFHEFAVKVNIPVAEVLNKLAELGIQGGYDLSHEYPELYNCLLICATETKTDRDLQQYRDALHEVLGEEP